MSEVRIDIVGVLLSSSFLLGTGVQVEAPQTLPTLPNVSVVRQARGAGVQIYTCAQGDGWAWKLKEPEATLFDERHLAIGKRFGGPKWRLKDGSEVQGKVLTSVPT